VQADPDAESSAATVVVCAYTQERWSLLLRALDSLKAQTLPPDEILVVVDNNPRLLEEARQSLRGVRVIANTDGSGLSGARNSGATAARTPFVAFLDDDAVAAPTWLENLVAPLGHEDVIGTGGHVEPSWAAGRPQWFPPEFQWVVGCTYAGMPVAPDGTIRNPIGASMAIRAKLLAELGGFRTDVGARRNASTDTGTAGTDETELAVRAASCFPELRFVYARQSRAYHFVPESRTTFAFFRRRCRDEGKAKALMAGPAALDSEKHYVSRVLPKAVVANLSRAVRTRDPGAALRALAILVGLAETASSYATWRLRTAISP
jgi:glucosyl-dolichyl phosphate glucuronosyltransferase